MKMHTNIDATYIFAPGVHQKFAGRKVPVTMMQSPGNYSTNLQTNHVF
jgi:hypothetical protein